MINFDDVYFSERRPEEDCSDKFLLTLSVFIPIYSTHLMREN